MKGTTKNQWIRIVIVVGILLVLPFLIWCGLRLLANQFGFLGARESVAIWVTTIGVLYASWNLTWRLVSSPESRINRINRMLHNFCGWLLLFIVMLLNIGHLATYRQVIPGDEVTEVTYAAFHELLSRETRPRNGPLYLSEGENKYDIYKSTMTRLRRDFPTMNLLPHSQRPKDKYWKEIEDGQAICPGMCADDNYLNVSFSEFKFWRIAQVSYRGAAFDGSMLLIKMGREWRLLAWLGEIYI